MRDNTAAGAPGPAGGSGPARRPCDGPDPDDAPPFAGAVRVAGLLWVALGGGQLAGVAAFLAAAPAPPGLKAFASAYGAGLGGAACVAGFRLASGRSADPRGPALLSVLVAGFGLALALGLCGLDPLVAEVVWADLRAGKPHAVVGAGALGLCPGYVLAGALAFAGRRHYLAWRADGRPPTEGG